MAAPARRRLAARERLRRRAVPDAVLVSLDAVRGRGAPARAHPTGGEHRADGSGHAGLDPSADRPPDRPRAQRSPDHARRVVAAALLTLQPTAVDTPPA